MPASAGQNGSKHKPRPRPRDEACLVAPDSAPVCLRRGIQLRWQLAMLLLLVATVCGLAGVVGDVWEFAVAKIGGLLFLAAGFALWRWGWFGLHVLRAVVYRFWKFPRLRRRAQKAAALRGPPADLAIVVMTYREEPWITDTVFDSIFRELAALSELHRHPKIVVSSGSEADDSHIRAVYERWSSRLQGEHWPPELVLLRQTNGKRGGIADAFRQLAADEIDPDGVVVLMDGDTVMENGLLQGVLPLFSISPPVAALTTNEQALVKGPGWFAEWMALKFGQRHLQMCSLALSNKVLTLTGRLSAFRAGVVTDASYYERIEHDYVENWLWGRYELLSGDDKSSWYWIASRGLRMLYVPDAMATTLEVVEGNSIHRALANMRRWSGNMLRSSGRGIALGPMKLGLFTWWCLIDQRISIWTTLLGPTASVLAVFCGHYEVAAAYLLWALFVRATRTLAACCHGRRISFWYPPLQLVTDWIGAFLKAWVTFHPAKQVWANRGGTTLDSTRRSPYRIVQSAAAKYFYVAAISAFLLCVGNLTGYVPILKEMRLLAGTAVAAQGQELSDRHQKDRYWTGPVVSE